MIVNSVQNLICHFGSCERIKGIIKHFYFTLLKYNIIKKYLYERLYTRQTFVKIVDKYLALTIHKPFKLRMRNSCNVNVTMQKMAP